MLHEQHRKEMYSKIFLTFTLISCIKSEACPESGEDAAVVQIREANSSSRVVGCKNVTWKGETFYAFRGMHYAQAPLGELRFKDTQPLAALPARIEARYDGHDCPSIYAENAAEDCLLLNVYTKSLQADARLPVIVFLHAGGLYVGSGSSRALSPEYLLSHELVLVSCNYRLGSLGFLSLGTAAVPGNAGFKDQVQALRWVQRYIQHFGGNAADVTLMGYSAGALSVSLQLVSPMSRGLFHKAIVMSGALPPQTVLPAAQQRKLAVRQAQALNCSCTAHSSAAQLLACFARYSGPEIAGTLRSLFDFGKDNPIYLWLPVLERDFGQQRFLHADYYESLRGGQFHRVPLLIGFTDGEFCTSAAQLLQHPKLLHTFQHAFDEVAPKIFMYAERENARHVSDSLRAHYLRDGNNSFVRLCDLFSDAIIRFGAQRLAAYAAKYVPVYSYKFAYRGKYSNLDYATNEPRVEHLDDLMYLFGMQPQRFLPQSDEAQIVELYSNFIYDFVAHGKPSSNVASTYPRQFTLITTKLQQRNGTNFEEAAFWQQMFP